MPPGGARSRLQVPTVGVARDIAHPRSTPTTEIVRVSPAISFLILSLIIMIILEALTLIYMTETKNAPILPKYLCVFTLILGVFHQLKNLITVFCANFLRHKVVDANIYAFSKSVI